MKVSLICSGNMEPLIIEILEKRNIVIDVDATTVIVEKGFNYPDDKIIILFDPSTLSYLMSLLDEMNRTDKKKTKPSVISGKLIGGSNEGYNLINFNSISYFEGLSNDVFCVVKNNKYKIKEKLYEVDELLKNEGFIRISKSHIVNIIKVQEIIPWFNGKILLRMEEASSDLDVSRKYSKTFKEFLNL